MQKSIITTGSVLTNTFEKNTSNLLESTKIVSLVESMTPFLLTLKSFIFLHYYFQEVMLKDDVRE